jgi:hypothetical protein
VHWRARYACRRSACSAVDRCVAVSTDAWRTGIGAREWCGGPSALHGRPRTGAATTDGPRTGSAQAVWRLDVHSGVERAFPCVRPLPGRFPGAGRPGKGRCGDGWAGGPGERDACRAGGRSGRGLPAGSSVRYSARGTRAEMWLSCWSARSSVILSVIAVRVLPGRRSRSRSLPGTASSGSRSPIAPGRGRRSCVLSAVMRKAVAGFSLLRASRHGGAGVGAAGGW